MLLLRLTRLGIALPGNRTEFRSGRIGNLRTPESVVIWDPSARPLRLIPTFTVLRGESGSCNLRFAMSHGSADRPVLQRSSCGSLYAVCGACFSSP